MLGLKARLIEISLTTSGERSKAQAVVSSSGIASISAVPRNEVGNSSCAPSSVPGEAGSTDPTSTVNTTWAASRIRANGLPVRRIIIPARPENTSCVNAKTVRFVHGRRPLRLLHAAFGRRQHGHERCAHGNPKVQDSPTMRTSEPTSPGAPRDDPPVGRLPLRAPGLGRANSARGSTFLVARSQARLVLQLEERPPRQAALPCAAQRCRLTLSVRQPVWGLVDGVRAWRSSRSTSRLGRLSIGSAFRAGGGYYFPRRNIVRLLTPSKGPAGRTVAFAGWVGGQSRRPVRRSVQRAVESASGSGSEMRYRSSPSRMNP